MENNSLTNQQNQNNQNNFDQINENLIYATDNESTSSSDQDSEISSSSSEDGDEENYNFFSQTWLTVTGLLKEEFEESFVLQLITRNNYFNLAKEIARLRVRHLIAGTEVSPSTLRVFTNDLIRRVRVDNTSQRIENSQEIQQALTQVPQNIENTTFVQNVHSDLLLEMSETLTSNPDLISNFPFFGG